MPLRTTILAAALLLPANLRAQSPAAPSPQTSPQPPSTIPSARPAPLPAPQVIPTPAAQAALTPGALQLLTLDGQFNESVARGGGAAFASWFAEDAVTLNNGKKPILGKANIALTARWTPDQYQLTWQPMGAQMGAANDMGFTWGHYDAQGKDPKGNPVLTSGRYITIWKRLPDHTWKVALDASADEPLIAPAPTH